MKKILLLIITLFLTAQTIKAQSVVLDTNGVTVKWTGTTVPTPYFVQASPRGTLEWFAIVDDITTLYIRGYAGGGSGRFYFIPPGESTPIPFNNIVTTLVTRMDTIFQYQSSFNQPIGSWDVSNVIDMTFMFLDAYSFNQNIGSWNVSNVTAMRGMFQNALSFNQPIGNWDVSNVTDMGGEIFQANVFGGMFNGAAAFNQPIGNWNVSNVNDMSYMFHKATDFNQPIGNWNVSNVTNMSHMFYIAPDFNQNIASWNVSNVTDMSYMFTQAEAFNQDIGNWDVSNVNDMTYMFWNCYAFNQDIGNWNVSNVTNMQQMFLNANSFNQNIGSWNVSNVTNMGGMFDLASAFNQNIGSWNISNVGDMNGMFNGVELSTANYDDTLLGWATIGPNETPLQSNLLFSGGNSNYCNGASARNSIISTYGWTITDAGLNCELSTETFDATVLKLYPNPVTSVLNVTVDYNLINQPYSIVDGLGRVVLNGSINEVDTAINVEQLSKGIYYLKLSDSNASKFVKE